MLQDYDMIPHDMRIYLRNYGRHFNKKLCDFAVGLMRKHNTTTGRMERIEPMSKEKVDKMLQEGSITLAKAKGYDYVYVANMGKADFLGSSITDDAHLAKYVKDVVEDVDGSEALVFNRWLADMDTKDTPIDWEEML